ncbi:CotH kinase family protein [Bacteroides helcogenes]|uniref:CotH kinase family protein n=2 Tax=Bacteroides helcogenes TaxID=290053 RepID=UPI00031190A8|nr:CotH kinase family protein [Bacteroides helcogenes]MDY5239812.1 CotH kinase family protein [Bacteroides helcogenes]
MASIEKYMNEIEHILYSDTTSDLTLLYRDYIDMDTFADWWLVHELAQNAEPNGPRSCYMYKDKEGLLKAGPVWDFDLAFISVGLDKGGDIRPSRLNRTDVVLLTGDSIYNRRALWYDCLLQDKQFLTRVKERWHKLEPRFRALTNDIDRWQALIEKSAIADEQLWKGQDPARFDTFTSFHSSVSNLKQVYLYRIESLNKLLHQKQCLEKN